MKRLALKIMVATLALRISLAVLPVWSGIALAEGAEPVAAAEAMFAAGNFAQALRQVNDLLVEDQQISPSLRARLYLLKARLELAFRHTDELALWLAKAHGQDPALTLDPLIDPPGLVEVWHAVIAKPIQSGGKLVPGRQSPPASPPAQHVSPITPRERFSLHPSWSAYWSLV